MRILLIKLSSLGDVIHALPAVQDAWLVNKDIHFDWVIEEAFAEIPQWHSAVERVFPIGQRRWRHHWWLTRAERLAFRRDLRHERYDLVLDAQGLIKSAIVAHWARGQRAGLDWRSAWESPASLVYQKRFRVEPAQHAITRMRQLFAHALDYPFPEGEPEYGILREQLPRTEWHGDLILLHGTTWPSKHWPESYWQTLIKWAEKMGWKVLLPWGNEAELNRAHRLAVAGGKFAQVLPRLNLQEMAAVMTNVRMVVGVDSGLVHLAAALNVPTLTLYGPTRPDYTGTRGRNQIHLVADFPCAPCLRRQCTFQGEAQVEPACFGTISPGRVEKEVIQFMESMDERDA